MKQWTEAECLVTAISHMISHRKDLSKRVVAEKAGVSAPYLTLLLKQDRGKTLQTFERVANACDLTISKAIAIGHELLSESGLENIPPHTKKALTEIDRIEGLNEVLNDLKNQVGRIEAGRNAGGGLIVEAAALAEFPFLKTYLQILNQACLAGDTQFAKDALRRLAQIILDDGDSDDQQAV